LTNSLQVERVQIEMLGGCDANDTESPGANGADGHACAFLKQADAVAEPGHIGRGMPARVTANGRRWDVKLRCNTLLREACDMRSFGQ
jgi:hypothetical protein